MLPRPSETEIKLFQPLKEYWNYFKIVSCFISRQPHLKLK